MPLTSEGHILLIRQYRQALNRETLEFPAGAIDPGTDVLETGHIAAGNEMVIKQLREMLAKAAS